MTPNWILVRGLIREAAHWGVFPEQLVAAFPGSRVHLLDLPGNGKFFDQPTPVAIDKMVAHLREQLEPVRTSSSGDPYIAVSMSLGAMVTTRWINLYPQDLNAAVLINTSLRRISPFYRRISPYAYAQMVRIFLAQDIALREQRILDLTTKAVREPHLLRDRVLTNERHPLRWSNAFRQVIAAAVHPRVEKPSVPTLILNSLGDQLVHPDCSAAIQKKWKAPMKRHAWAGHDLPLDDPKWCVEAIQEWANELSLVPASARPELSHF